MNEFILTTCNFTKNHFKMINFPTKITLRYFQGFCLKVSDDLFYRTTPCMFVVNRLCTVFLRESRFMLTIRGIPENRDPGHQWDPKKTPENRDSEPYKNRKTGTLVGPTKNLKTWTLEKPENRDPKKQNTVPEWGWKSCS